MKKSDINKLEKVVDLYCRIETLLDKVRENAYWSDERFNKDKTVSELIAEMHQTAVSERKHIEGKINVFKEML